MGLASFNRARRSRLEVEKFEAERFKKDNAARWGAHHGVDTDRKQEAKDLEKSRKLEHAASEEIGEKAEEGIRMGEKEGGIADLPLRQDHAAEIAGRTLENNQEPKDPVERVMERIPSGTATEELVEHTQVDQPGPTTALLDAVAKENTPASERDPLDHDGDGKKGGSVAADDLKTAAQIAAEKRSEAEKTEEKLPDASKSAGPKGGSESSAKKTAASKK